MHLEYDVIIAGAGPAGLTAGIYVARAGLEALVFEQGVPGGQTILTDYVENYPGFPEGLNGRDLADRFVRQLANMGIEITHEAVTQIVPKERKGYLVTAGDKEYSAKTIILAMGTQARKLGVRGEGKFIGRGVSYCAVCDAPLFRNKKVAVVGGGDTAVEESLYLSKFAREVHIIHRRDELRAVNVLTERAMANEKITIRWNTVVNEIKGDKIIETLDLKNTPTGEITEEQFDGVFVFIGTYPRTSCIGFEMAKDEQGYIITDELLATNRAGVFAVGDIRAKALRQVSTAVGDGALAAMSAEKYLIEKY
jgi:thioredoxin reductase (NADPH)